MANISGKWALTFSGEINQECKPTSLISLDDKIHTVYQTVPSGDFFQDQIASESTGLFAQIPNIICGGGYLVELIESEAQIPHLIDAYKTDKLLIPRFPMEIEISGLENDYDIGNGTYEITSFFQNESPTYKSQNGWFIVKMEDGYWYVVPNIDGLGTLKGGNGNPTDGFFILDNCSENCPTAIPSDPRNPRTPTPQPAPTPTPIGENAIVFTTVKAEDTKIKLQWRMRDPSTKANVKSWTIQMTTLEYSQNGDVSELDWDKSTEFNFDAETTTNTFENLTHSKVYYFRIRLVSQNDQNSDWLTISTNTTIPATSVSANIFLNSVKQPNIRWNAPTVLNPELNPFLEFDYEIHIEKLAPNTNVVEKLEILKRTGRSIENYVDTDSLVEGVYRYRMIFKSGRFFGTLIQLEINIDRTNPNPPILKPKSANTNQRILEFSWNADSDVKLYRYRFNDSSWTTTTKTSLGLNAVPGRNIFRIIAEDHSGNRSEESVQEINLDITKPNPPILDQISSITTKTSQVFSWSLNEDDLKSFVYRLYRGNAQDANAVIPWTIVDKSITQIKLELSQGINTFSIKSVDHVGNESVIVNTIVKLDSVQPPKPLLSRINKDVNPTPENLGWKWKVSENESDVFGWKYRFTTWKEGESPTDLNYILVDKQITSKEVTGIEGYNKFEIYSIDEAGNGSDVSSETILIDTSPPRMPTLLEPVSRILANKVVIRFRWEVTSDTYSVVYRLNSGTWKEQSLSADSSIELNAREGINTFEIYAKDSNGNKSNTNSIQVMIDSVAPIKPVITGPFGECPNELWKDLWIACQNSKLGIKTDLMITYSFMPKNTLLGGHFHLNKARESAIYSEDVFVDGVDIIKNVKNAFADWSNIIKNAFPNVTVNFVNIGTETNSMPSASDVSYQNDHGDIRIAFSSDSSIQVKSRGNRFIDNNLKLKTGASDIIFDSRLNWVDHSSEMSADSYDLRMNARYYIGKSLGLGVSPSSDIGMYKLRKGKVNLENANSGDTEIFLKTYSLPSKSNEVSDSFRVVKTSDLNITFESSERVSFEWKYIFIGEDSTREILTTSKWNVYPTKNIRNGTVNITIDKSSRTSDTIRFYVRSIDESGNTSDASTVDIKMMDEPENVDISSINTRCELDSKYKHGNNCWDKYGLFSAEVIPSRSPDFKKFETFRGMAFTGSKNYFVEYPNLNLNSLLPSTQYKIKIISRKDAGIYRVGDTIPNSHIRSYSYSFSAFGESNELLYTTDDSDIIPPDKVEITKLEHHKDLNSDGFTTPLGETRLENHPTKTYVPAMKLSWNANIPSDFGKYEIFVSNYSTFESKMKPGVSYAYPPKTMVKKVYDVNQQSLKIELDDYSRKYYFKIVIHDSYGNTKESDVKTYTTVDENLPPIVQKEMEFFIVGRSSVYNERPGDKWKIQFTLPKVIDGNHPTTHKIPDTEYASRTDYTDSDWISRLGHLPFKIECADWPTQRDLFNYSVFYVSRNSVHDHDLNLTGTPVVVDSDDNSLKFIMRHFEQNKHYKLVVSSYDITGHYVTNTYVIRTPVADTSIDNPPDPTLDIDYGLYWHGKDSFGNDLKETQWVLEFSWHIKETENIEGFLLGWKHEDTDTWFDGLANLENLKKVINGNIATYSIRIRGFLPNKTYQFRTSAINDKGLMSNESSQNITTPVGDIKPPERPVMTERSIRVVSREGKHYLAFKFEPAREGNLDFYVFTTKNVSNRNFYSWENRWRIPPDVQRPREWMFVQLDEEEVELSVVFAYADSAFNWSVPVYERISASGRQLSSSTINELVNDSELSGTFLDLNYKLNPLY